MMALNMLALSMLALSMMVRNMMGLHKKQIRTMSMAQKLHWDDIRPVNFLRT